MQKAIHTNQTSVETRCDEEIHFNLLHDFNHQDFRFSCINLIFENNFTSYTNKFQRNFKNRKIVNFKIQYLIQFAI